MSPYTYWAMPVSLYSGKARSYLRKRRIDFVERVPGDPRFGTEIVPQLGRFILPVLECPDGTLVQDTVDIIDHFERDYGPEESVYPTGATQLVVAHTLEMLGGEAMLRPAMHYRWSFDEANLDFIRREFTSGLAPTADAATAAAVFDWASGAMRGVTAEIGVNADTIADIERSYEEFLDLLNSHLALAPYLLGGRPTIADFGFIAPLYAHLARDPYPAALMKQRAPRVWRWVERMIAPGRDAGEYLDSGEELFADDQTPASLRALLAYFGEEYIDEAVAFVGFVDDWLAENDVEDGEVIPYAIDDRFLGRVRFGWRGHEIEAGVHPYRVLMLQRIQWAFDSASAEDQSSITELFDELGIGPLLELRPRRRMERRDNRETWGAVQQPRLGAATAG